MGVVYKARHVKLNRVVALKMILAGTHAGAAEMQRFAQEAQAIASVRHPHVVQIHEVGEVDVGGSLCPFFSLEFCAGGTLAGKLGKPLSSKDAAESIEKLARAMQAAHDKGVVHRDLKPGNVLFLEDGTPKITDFGLAKLTAESGGAAEQTKSGAMMGTPAYMSPEQAGGKTKEMGPLCDVWALGAVLYECLTGRPPFQADTALDTMLLVIEAEPMPRELPWSAVLPPVYPPCPAATRPKLSLTRRRPARILRRAPACPSDRARFPRTNSPCRLAERR